MAATTAVSATQLVDSSGNVIANATIAFLPVTNLGLNIPYIIGDGGGLASSEAVTTVVANGHFNITLADTSQTLPINVGYSVTVTDNITQKELLGPGYTCFQPSGGSVAFDTVPPNLAPNVTVQTGPRGLPGLDGTINNPITNQLNLTQGFTANGMTVQAGDSSLQNYAVSFAGASGFEFAGIDSTGGLHWEAPVSSTIKVTSPEFDLSIPGSPSIISTSIVDGGALASSTQAIVLGTPSGRSFASVDNTGVVTLSSGLVIAGSFSFTGTFSAPSQTGAVVDADGWNYYTALDAGSKLQIFQNYGSITNQLTFGTYNSWSPQLSADGTYICFMSDRPTSGSLVAINAYRMNLGGSEQVPLSFNPDLSLQTDISILAVAGQSLSGGAASGPPVTVTPFGNNVMLQGGAMQTGSYGNGSPTSLVPLIEMNFSGSGDETPCSSMSNQFAYLCSIYKGFLPTVASQSSGAGGHTLDALFQPSAGWYSHMTSAFPFFESLSTAIGRKVYPRAIGFVHGESDGNYPNASGNLNYGSELVSYYLKWIQDIGVSAGIFTAPPLFLTQTSSEYAYSNHVQNVISPQQLAVCINNPGRFYFAGPEYMMQQTYDTQNVHLLAKGYQWLGQLLGVAMFRALVLKQRYTGLMPKLALRFGNIIYVTFRVPRPIGVNSLASLVFDTTNIPSYGLTGGMYGFEVRNSSGTIVPISSATIVPDAEGNLTQVKIVCSSDPGVGGKVGYANTYQATTGSSQVGPSGNLRTLWGVPALYPTIQADVTHGDLFDWCAHFNLSYTS